MVGIEEFVRRIVSRSGIPRSASRRDLERELQAHLEDAMEEADPMGGKDDHILSAVCARFGDPDEIARAFEGEHRWERRAIFLADAVMLMCLSVLTVGALILGMQLAIAISLGIAPAHAFPRLRGEIVAFVSLALGYMGLYLGERLFRERRLLKALAIDSILFVCFFPLVSGVLHLGTAAPVTAFLAGIAVRMLQATSWRPAWFLGTVVPTTAACLSAGRLLSTGSEISLGAAVLVRWLGLTAACYALTLLSRKHAARSQVSL